MGHPGIGADEANRQQRSVTRSGLEPRSRPHLSTVEHPALYIRFAEHYTAGVNQRTWRVRIAILDSLKYFANVPELRHLKRL